MRYHAALILFALPTAALADDGAAEFNGTWGRDIDCARAPLLPDGTLHANPVVIRGTHLQHGPTACRLDWFRADKRPGRVFAAARALCGEDSQRAYQLSALWEKDETAERLTLVWNEEILQGPLFRCSP